MTRALATEALPIARKPLSRPRPRVGISLTGWLLIALGALVWTVLVLPLTLLLVPFFPSAKTHFRRFTSFALRGYFASYWCLRVKVDRRRAATTGPRILVVNHQSLLDPLLMLSLEPGLHGPARDYAFRVPILAGVMRLLGFVGIGVHDAQGFQEMVRRGASSGPLLFFPEGTRTRDGEIGAFERGAFRLAMLARIPIQPVVIDGLFQVLPPGAFFTRRSGNWTVRVTYLEPFVPLAASGNERNQTRRVAEEVRERMRRELAGQRSLACAEDAALRAQGSVLEQAIPLSYGLPPGKT